MYVRHIVVRPSEPTAPRKTTDFWPPIRTTRRERRDEPQRRRVARRTPRGPLFAFVVLAYLFDSSARSRCRVVVFNPPVKWAVYGASFWLGSHLLGPVPGASVADVSLSAGLDILFRQLVGNTILAAVLAASGTYSRSV